jgi:cell wall-associated NlpC family hydrolase
MWWGRYIGLDYGRAHCWQLVRLVYQQERGVILPDYPSVSHDDRNRVAETIAREKDAGLWVQVDQPRAFDVALMRGKRAIWHTGVMADAASVLHTEKATGAVLVPIAEQRIASRIAGFWRWQG